MVAHAVAVAADVDDVAVMEEAVDQRACHEVGRDPGTVRRTWSGGCVCAPTEREVATLAGFRDPADTDFIGTPARIIDRMKSFIDLGVDYFMLDCGGFPDLTTVETLIAEVMPHFLAEAA